MMEVELKPKIYGLNQWIRGGTKKVYIPNIDDKINSEKERLIYIKILQEFDKEINEISKINKQNLIIFLTEKQKEFF